MNSRLAARQAQELAVLRRQVRFLANRRHRELQKSTKSFREKQVRLARTLASGFAYPADPANTYEVELGFGTFTPTPGLQTLTFNPYVPGAIRIAHAHCIPYLPEGTICLVDLIGGNYYITSPVYKNITDLRINGYDIQYKEMATCSESDWITLAPGDLC